ncbi:MAG TPA: hypothetical protein VEK57_28340 [Thermoanaerobaculia bacterium]|nr:hypothetical protein [Thermoanaerobaculia bacterium]
MRMFEPSFIVLIVTTALLLGYLIVARRRQSTASASIFVLVAAYGGIALASFFAVRSFGRTLAEVTQLGGGIYTVSRGIWEAALLPLEAAWATAILTLLALLFLLPEAKKAFARDAQPGSSYRLLWLPGLALAGGVTAVVLFRKAMAFVINAITPGQQVGVGPEGVVSAVTARLFTASAGSAVCFAVAVVLLAVAFRSRRAQPSRASFGIAVFALVVSLGVSAALITELRAYSSHYRNIALHGGYKPY